MKISARNQLTGTVAKIQKSALSAIVTLSLPGNQSLAAHVTAQAVKDLKLKPGAKVTAVIKASSVLLGVE
jgi:molybdate transport system regulatory protein